MIVMLINIDGDGEEEDEEEDGDDDTYIFWPVFYLRYEFCLLAVIWS